MYNEYRTPSLPTVLLSTVKLLEVYYNPKMLNKSDQRDRIFNSKFHSTLSSVVKSQDAPLRLLRMGISLFTMYPCSTLQSCLRFLTGSSRSTMFIIKAHCIQSAVTQNTTVKLAIRLHWNKELQSIYLCIISEHHQQKERDKLTFTTLLLLYIIIIFIFKMCSILEPNALW